MQMSLDPRGAPRHQQIYDALRTAILNGTLRRGERLPSSRVLANDLGVSRTTVLGAFTRLLAEGLVTGNTGAGTRVAMIPANGVAATATRAPRGAEHAGTRNALRPLSPAAGDPPWLSDAARVMFAEGRWRRIPTKAIPFASGIPALELFPVTTWTRLAARRWRLSGRELLLPDDSQGYAPLREAIARYAVTARGVRCTAEQIVIVNGAQHALDLCARLLVGPGDDVWMEYPGYSPARGVFAAAGARLVDVPVDRDGLDVARGCELAPAARLALVTPSFQSPLGVTMSLERRLALLEWARTSNAWIVEDDYNGEYRYDTAPIPAMQGMDTSGRVLYIGTFSKTLSPAIRLGYLILPPEMAPEFARARLILDRHSPVPEQAILADFISSGHFARHIRRTRALYLQRQRAFTTLAARELEGLVRVDGAVAGLWLVGWLPRGVVDLDVVDEARTRGVVVVPMSGYHGGSQDGSGLLFGYAPYSPAQMRVAMRELAAAIRTVQARALHTAG